jgi:hypothetical protein
MQCSIVDTLKTTIQLSPLSHTRTLTLEALWYGSWWCGSCGGHT